MRHPRLMASSGDSHVGPPCRGAFLPVLFWGAEDMQRGDGSSAAGRCRRASTFVAVFSGGGATLPVLVKAPGGDDVVVATSRPSSPALLAFTFVAVFSGGGATLPVLVKAPGGDDAVAATCGGNL
ncbi:hypothetical protein CYMTET_56052 [Cymbomonas tetramitiformis]|uniref:Uncharacterized protein n=1 Tax=Cymbomonas tetramitiformis TaxID=36881 RepID=A0AAE0BC37_9CHLO|nr:hypothetical protein CYMTET_56052 [Cymbomonas tetramitiformis]